jgi:hypothetical protein
LIENLGGKRDKEIIYSRRMQGKGVTSLTLSLSLREREERGVRIPLLPRNCNGHESRTH